MGHTRVIYTDATTAEAATVLKGSGFLETNEGGLYTSQNSPVKVYVLWGRTSYYPQILLRLDFQPRIQIHLKCRDGGPVLDDLTAGAVNGLRGLCPGTRIRVFDADRALELAP